MVIRFNRPPAHEAYTETVALLEAYTHLRTNKDANKTSEAQKQRSQPEQTAESGK